MPPSTACVKSPAPPPPRTLTTVAVFAPIVFVEGIAGQVFRDQALTVVASLMVSLVVALFLVPMLASRYGLGRVSRRGPGPPRGGPACKR